MAGPIIVSALLSASSTDVLQGGRLQTAPSNGVMTFELQASLADATNNYVATIQLPNGDIPLESVLVPGTNATDDGILDDRQKLMISVPVTQGGHVVLALTESGTATLIYRVTFTPAR